MTRRAATILVGLALAACASKGVPPGSPSSGSIPAQDYAGEYLRSVCVRIERCCPAEVKARRPGLQGGSAACEAYLGPTIRAAFRELTDAAAAGRVRYDGQAARACLVEEEARCGGPRLAACTRAIQPRLAIGASCRSSSECIGSYCNRTGPTAAGTCVPRFAIDEPCHRSDQCESGVCASSSGRCIADLPPCWFDKP